MVTSLSSANLDVNSVWYFIPFNIKSSVLFSRVQNKTEVKRHHRLWLLTQDLSEGQLGAVMICQQWAKRSAGAEGRWMRIKVRLLLLELAAVLTKTEAIDFLLVLSLYCTNRQFPTLPHRWFKCSNDSNHRRQSSGVPKLNVINTVPNWLCVKCK